VKRIEFAEMIKISVYGSKLYKIILTERRYIKNVFKKLQNENMLLKRSLMNSEYISLKILFNLFKNESARNFFSALYNKFSENAYETDFELFVYFYLRFLKEKESGKKDLLLK
jgi:hypothetical protein